MLATEYMKVGVQEHVAGTRVMLAAIGKQSLCLLEQAGFD